MSSSETHKRAKATVRLLKTLVEKLPASVPLASPEDKINQVFQNIPETNDDEDGQWRVFNRRMDALFGNDVRDSNGRLHIHRGPHGMDLVMDYFQRCVDNNSLQWEAAEPKFARLVIELKQQR